MWDSRNDRILNGIVITPPGNFKGYAFVEFRFSEVAKIVAESMNNYLMHEKLMRAKVVPPEKVRPAIFRNRVNPEKPPGKKARAIAKKQASFKIWV